MEVWTNFQVPKNKYPNFDIIPFNGHLASGFKTNLKQLWFKRIFYRKGFQLQILLFQFQLQLQLGYEYQPIEWPPKLSGDRAPGSDEQARTPAWNRRGGTRFLAMRSVRPSVVTMRQTDSMTESKN
jgi:hypothetical protein